MGKQHNVVTTGKNAKKQVLVMQINGGSSLWAMHGFLE